MITPYTWTPTTFSVWNLSLTRDGGNTGQGTTKSTVQKKHSVVGGFRVGRSGSPFNESDYEFDTRRNSHKTPYRLFVTT